jgi:hypothetical protein
VNGKSTGILLAAAGVILAFIWFVDRPIRLERLRQADHSILPGFDPAAINYIEVKPRGTNEIHVECANPASNVWRMTQPISYPAEGLAITALLDAMKVLTWQFRISPAELKDQPDAQEKYGFSQPQFELVMKGVGAPRKILIGQLSAMGDQVFMEVVGNPEIYLVSADLLKLVPWNKDQWRDASLLNLAKIHYDSIQVHSTGSPTLTLESDATRSIWLMKQPVVARADTAKINQLLANLQALQVRQFVSDDPKADLESYGLQTSPQTPELSLSFWNGTNMAAELEVGATLTNFTNFAFARRQDPSNVVIIERTVLRPWQSSSTNFLDYHLISVSPDTIGTIAAQGQDNFTAEKQASGRWLIRGATTFPADARLMHDWLASFTNIQTQVEKTVATDFTPYGLTHPLLQFTLQSAAGPGSSNSTIAQIEFGTNNSDRVFERRPDESFVNYITPDDFDRLPRVSWQLRDRAIWSFDTSNVLSLTIHQLGVERKYLRDPGGDWTFAPPYHGPPEENWPRLEEGIHRLGDLHAIYWSGVGDAHWKDFGFEKADFSLSLVINHAGQLETNSISFGGSSPYTYPYAAVMQNGERWIFEFPPDLYENFVLKDMIIPAELRPHR